MSYRALMFVAAMAAAAPLAAQDAATIDPGMTRAEVVERLGKPINERKSGDHTYLYYRNGCEKTCGMNDLVILADGRVSDAIFRSSSRHYSGESSSPNGVQPSRSEGGDAGVAAVRKAKRGGIVIARPAESAPATVTGVQVVPAEGTSPNGEAQAAAGAPAATRAATTPAATRTTTPAESPRAAAASPKSTGPRPGGVVAKSGNAAAGGNATTGARADAAAESGTGTSGVGTGGGGTAGGNAPQVTAPGGNSAQVGSPEPSASPSAPVGANGQRPIMPVPLPGAKINPADSVRALTPNRPTPLPGAKINPADSIRAEAIRRQQADTTNKP